jgi:hypothetical protein
MSPRDLTKLAPCRHLRQRDGACLDCGHRWGETRSELQARQQEAREGVRGLVELLRRQHEDGQRLWRSYKATTAMLCGLLAVERRKGFALDDVVDQVVLFDARCAAGDVDGAVLALRSWLARVGA